MMSSRQVPNNVKNRSPHSNVGGPSLVPLYKDPSYDWSLDFRNSPTLESKFLHAVPKNIRSAATKYKIDLPTEALQWLDSHGGHYEMFADPNSDKSRGGLTPRQFAECLMRKLTAPLSLRSTFISVNLPDFPATPDLRRLLPSTTRNIAVCSGIS